MILRILFALLLLSVIPSTGCFSTQQRKVANTSTSTRSLNNTKIKSDDTDDDDDDDSAQKNPVKKERAKKASRIPKSHAPKVKVQQNLGPYYNGSYSLRNKVVYKNTKYLQPKLLSLAGTHGGSRYLRKTNFAANIEVHNKMLFRVTLRTINVKVHFTNGKRASSFKAPTAVLNPNEKRTFSLDKYFYLYRHVSGSAISGIIIEINYIRKHKMVMMKPKKSELCKYSSRHFDIQFLCKYSVVNLGFKIHNKSAKPIFIVWNETSFISAKGNTSKVMHKGIRYIRRFEHQPDTMLPPTSKYSDILVPSSYVYYSSILKRWSKKPMWLALNGVNEDKAYFSFYVTFKIGKRKKRILFKFQALFDQPKNSSKSK